LAEKAGLEVYAEGAENDDFWIEARPAGAAEPDRNPQRHDK
jgi:hypothetical protein